MTREVAVADGQDETTLYGFEQIGEFLESVERDGVIVFAADIGRVYVEKSMSAVIPAYAFKTVEAFY